MNLRFGRYETIQQIASGGMATVYLGRAVGVGGFERRVAIKVMHDHIAHDPDFLAMFLDEARLAARIHHPNVVSTIDVQQADDSTFLIMDYVEGCSLRKLLRETRKKRERIPLGVVCRMTIDTLQGLHAAHELNKRDGTALNLVHRDVSPHNVMVGTDGITRITDFGVARAEARLSSTRGGTLKGKIAYMPPEQGRGEDIDRRADIYAAGVVLWETLCQKRLFKADHEGALVAMILQGTDVSPRTVNPEVPEAIAAVCMKALAINPDERYPTTAVFAEALEEAAHGCGIRVANQRTVASYVQEYKVTIDTSRPPPLMDELSDVSEIDSRPIDFTPRGRLGSISDVADVPSVQTGTSQLTGIGAVHSARPHELSRPTNNAPKMLFAGLALGAFLAILGVVLVSGGDDAAQAPAAQPAAAADEAPAAPADPIPKDNEPEPETEPEKVAEKKADEEVDEKTAELQKKANAVATPKVQKKSGPPKTGGAKVKKPKSGNPLGFEFDDL